MTTDDIIRMAREAELYGFAAENDYLNAIERFAALVVAAERERVKQADAHTWCLNLKVKNAN